MTPRTVGERKKAVFSALDTFAFSLISAVTEL